MILTILGCLFYIIIIFKFKNNNLTSRNESLGDIYDQPKQNTAKKITELETSEFKQKLLKELIDKISFQESLQKELTRQRFLMARIIYFISNTHDIYNSNRKNQSNINASNFVAKVLKHHVAQKDAANPGEFERPLLLKDFELVSQLYQSDLQLKHQMQDYCEKWTCPKTEDINSLPNNSVIEKPTFLERESNLREVPQDLSESAKVNTELTEKVKALEIWHEKKIKLGEMHDFLQACLTIKEAETALTDLLKPLFPETHGAVYLINNSQNLLNEIAAWGTTHNDVSFEPKECWALRRGNAHVCHPTAPGLYCSHASSATNLTPTLCLPMIAKGQTLGLLYLRFHDSQAIGKLTQELAETVAQNIAMSFANLKLQEELRYQSLRDPLTSLYNRRYLQESLIKEVERAERNQRPLSVLLLDIDRFKRFNDIHGHTVGDLVLKKVGIYLLSKIRQYDIACRYGGEELVVVMPNASIQDTTNRAEEIRKGIKQLELKYDGKTIEPITVSIGVSCFPEHCYDPDGLISTADKALYQAKDKGRDCVCVSSSFSS